MTEPLFCLASLMLLAWVILLKLEVGRLAARARNLRARIAEYTKTAISGAELARESRIWRGKTPRM